MLLLLQTLLSDYSLAMTIKEREDYKYNGGQIDGKPSCISDYRVFFIKPWSLKEGFLRARIGKSARI